MLRENLYRSKKIRYNNNNNGHEPRDNSRPSNEPTDVAQGSKMNQTRTFMLKTVHTGTITAYKYIMMLCV